VDDNGDGTIDFQEFCNLMTTKTKVCIYIVCVYVYVCIYDVCEVK